MLEDADELEDRLDVKYLLLKAKVTAFEEEDELEGCNLLLDTEDVLDDIDLLLETELVEVAREDVPISVELLIIVDEDFWIEELTGLLEETEFRDVLLEILVDDFGEDVEVSLTDDDEDRIVTLLIGVEILFDEIEDDALTELEDFWEVGVLVVLDRIFDFDVDNVFAEEVVGFDVLEAFVELESGRVVELEARDVEEILELELELDLMLLAASAQGFKATEFSKLYTFSVFAPPQNSDELPLQARLQLFKPFGARAPPLEMEFPQSIDRVSTGSHSRIHNSLQT